MRTLKTILAFYIQIVSLYKNYNMKKVFITGFLLMNIYTLFAQNDTAAEAAIKTVIEKETQSFINADADGMIACWANTAYASSLVYYGGGIFYQTNPKLDLPTRFKALLTGAKPDGSTFSNTGYVIHINQNSALVYYDQTNTDKDGSKTYAHAVRSLEQINGEWKLIYVGGVFYTPAKN
jgi:hypothetical protein